MGRGLLTEAIEWIDGSLGFAEQEICPGFSPEECVAAVHLGTPHGDRLDEIVGVFPGYPRQSRFGIFRPSFRKEAAGDFFGISTMELISGFFSGGRIGLSC